MLLLFILIGVVYKIEVIDDSVLAKQIERGPQLAQQHPSYDEKAELVMGEGGYCCRRGHGPRNEKNPGNCPIEASEVAHSDIPVCVSRDDRAEIAEKVEKDCFHLLMCLSEVGLQDKNLVCSCFTDIDLDKCEITSFSRDHLQHLKDVMCDKVDCTAYVNDVGCGSNYRPKDHSPGKCGLNVLETTVAFLTSISMNIFSIPSVLQLQLLILEIELIIRYSMAEDLLVQ